MNRLPTAKNYSHNIIADKSYLLTELQSYGVQLSSDFGAPSRIGGAGPTDHKAMTVLGSTVMVPVHTYSVEGSPFSLGPIQSDGTASLNFINIPVVKVTFPPQPRFYSLRTVDEIPYWKIATLHSTDVLASTVLQTCIRYGNKNTKCQFCAIGESLKSGRTIAKKSPEQLAEVAYAAMKYDGVRQVVLTTGTPTTNDRGASILCDSARAIKDATGLAIQAQCEPPDDFLWFKRLHESGVDSLGMHLEAWNDKVRAKIMPGKAEVPLSYYMDAFKASVKVFGRGQVSTYLLAGLGDTKEELIHASRTLIDLGVYPFVVPFVPVTGTQLENHPAPNTDFMRSVLSPIGAMLAKAGMSSNTVKAGCARCGACSTLSTFENNHNSCSAV